MRSSETVVFIALLLLLVVTGVHPHQPAGETHSVWLPCISRAIHQHKVSWRFTNGQDRFYVLYQTSSSTAFVYSPFTDRASVPERAFETGNFSLLLSSAKFEDAGNYTCYVNGKLTREVALLASKVTTRATNPVRAGSTIILICEISTKPRGLIYPRYRDGVYWYLDGTVQSSMTKRSNRLACLKRNTGSWTCAPRFRGSAEIASFGHYLDVYDPPMTMNTPVDASIWKTTHEAPSTTTPASSSLFTSPPSSSTTPPPPVSYRVPAALVAAVGLLSIALLAALGVACFVFSRRARDGLAGGSVLCGLSPVWDCGIETRRHGVAGRARRPPSADPFQPARLARTHQLQAVKAPVHLVREPITHLRNVPGPRHIQASTAAASPRHGVVYAEVRRLKGCRHDGNADAVYDNYDPVRPTDDDSRRHAGSSAAAARHNVCCGAAALHQTRGRLTPLRCGHVRSQFACRCPSNPYRCSPHTTPPHCSPLLPLCGFFQTYFFINKCGGSVYIWSLVSSINDTANSVVTVQSKWHKRWAASWVRTTSCQGAAKRHHHRAERPSSAQETPPPLGMELREVVDCALGSCVRHEPLGRAAFLRCFAAPSRKPRGTVILFDVDGAGRGLSGGHVVNYNKQGTSIHAEVLLLSAVRAALPRRCEGDAEEAPRGCTVHCYSTYSPCRDCVDYIQEFVASTGVRVAMRCCRLYELDVTRRRPEAEGVLRSLSSLGHDFRLMGPRDAIALLLGGRLADGESGASGGDAEPLVEMAGFGDEQLHAQVQRNRQIVEAYARYAGAVSLVLGELRVDPDKFPFLADFLAQTSVEPSGTPRGARGRPRGASSRGPGIGRQRPADFERALGAYGLFLHPRIVSREADREEIKRDLVAVMRKHDYQGCLEVSPCVCSGACVRACPCRQAGRMCIPLCGAHRATCTRGGAVGGAKSHMNTCGVQRGRATLQLTAKTSQDGAGEKTQLHCSQSHEDDIP
ncbi:uncharacterized protein LOC144721776 isoform X4 [Lampetra planeri]